MRSWKPRNCRWRLAGKPADLLLGRILVQQGDPAAAALAFKRTLSRPHEWQGADLPGPVRRRLARCYLETGRPGQARELLEQLPSDSLDPESFWLWSRCDLQEKVASDPTVMDQALAYRKSHPMDPEPSPYLGETRCAPCHLMIFRDQHQSRHARTYVHKDQYPELPFPDRPIVDPGNSQVTHLYHKTSDSVEVQTQVDGRVFRAIVDYVFGSGDRGFTPVVRDAAGGYFESRSLTITTPSAGISPPVIRRKRTYPLPSTKVSPSRSTKCAAAWTAITRIRTRS